MSSTAPPRAGRESGFLLVLAPLLALAAAIVWSHVRVAAPRGERAAPPPLDDALPVAGWSGRLELADGTFLVARLTPLNASARHQAFDSNALREVLGEPKGEPWRLNLLRSEGTGEPLSLARLCLRGSAGELRPPAPPLLEPGQPADPVRVLLAPPGQPLGTGQEVSLVLWGEAPPGGVVLELGETRVELLPDEVPRSEVVRSLARLEAPAVEAQGR